MSHTMNSSQPAADPVAYVADHDQELVDLTKQLLAIDSQNPPGSTTEIVQEITSFASDLGVSYERVADHPDKPNILLRLPGDSPYTLLYNGHLDTVPYDESAWSYDPLGELIENRIYGRGATDMKGAIAAMLQMLRGYVLTDTRPPVTLEFAFVSDEETAGQAGLPHLIEQDRLQADAAVIGEPTCKQEKYSVTVADKGSIWLTLEATGTAAHGSRPPMGANAIDSLVAAVDALRDELNQITFELPTQMADIADRSIKFYTPEMSKSDAQDLFQKPTFNLGKISGGTAINRVPETATAKIDIRITAGIDTQRIVQRIHTVLEEIPRVRTTDMSWSLGTYQSDEDAIVQATTATAATVAEGPVHQRSATGGGDAKKLRNQGISTVEFAFGTGTMHAVDEYITFNALRENAMVYTQLPYQLSETISGQE